MESKIIEDLVDSKNVNINYEDLRFFLNQKLKELYEKDGEIPLFDYADIRYSAMIDLLYEIMPSLRKELLMEIP